MKRKLFVGVTVVAVLAGTASIGQTTTSGPMIDAKAGIAALMADRGSLTPREVSQIFESMSKVLQNKVLAAGHGSFTPENFNQIFESMSKVLQNQIFESMSKVLQ